MSCRQGREFKGGYLPGQWNRWSVYEQNQQRCLYYSSSDKYCDSISKLKKSARQLESRINSCQATVLCFHIPV